MKELFGQAGARLEQGGTKQEVRTGLLLSLVQLVACEWPEFSFTEAGDVATYLIDEWLALGASDTNWLVSPVSGKIVGALRPEDIYHPSPVVRESGAVIQRGPQVKPQVEAGLLRWQWQQAVEEARSIKGDLPTSHPHKAMLTAKGRSGMADKLLATAMSDLQGIKAVQGNPLNPSVSCLHLDLRYPLIELSTAFNHKEALRRSAVRKLSESIFTEALAQGVLLGEPDYAPGSLLVVNTLTYGPKTREAINAKRVTQVYLPQAPACIYLPEVLDVVWSPEGEAQYTEHAEAFFLRASLRLDIHVPVGACKVDVFSLDVPSGMATISGIVTTGVAGATATISGSGFGATPGGLVFYPAAYEAVEVAAVSWSATSVVANIPDQADVGPGAFFGLLPSGSGEAALTATFTVLPATVAPETEFATGSFVNLTPGTTGSDGISLWPPSLSLTFKTLLPPWLRLAVWVSRGITSAP